MAGKINYHILTSYRNLKHCLLLVLTLFFFGSCEQEPPLGSLFITTEYDRTPEDNVECWLYESFYKFQHYEYLVKELSDEFGEVLFDDLEEGWYIIEARKTKSSLFTISSVDSVLIEAGRRTNKILILQNEE